jgi:hypothetical protein
MDRPPKPKKLTLVRVEWISFFAATAHVEKHFAISHAEAQRRLRRACAEGYIRSIKQRFHNRLDWPDPELETLIAPSEWREREVDYDFRDAEGLATEVAINNDDFHYWFGQQPKPVAASRRDEAVRELLEAGDRPPQNIPWKAFCFKVRDIADGWKNKKEGQSAHGFSDKQIMRIVVKERTSGMS